MRIMRRIKDEADGLCVAVLDNPPSDLTPIHKLAGQRAGLKQALQIIEEEMRKDDDE